MVAGDHVYAVSKFVTCLGAHHRREQLAAEERGAGNVRGHRIAVLRSEGSAAFAKIEPRLINYIATESRDPGRDCRKIPQLLDAGAGKIVLTQRLVLRFHLNSRNPARVVAETEIKLMVLRDHVIEAKRVVGSSVSYWKHFLQIVEGAKRYELPLALVVPVGNGSS